MKQNTPMILYDYPRSSAAYRVRIALNLKGLEYKSQIINLLDGEESNDEYKALNPQGLVPCLITSDGIKISQSLAICEYLEEVYPELPLLPRDAIGRSRVRHLSQLVACDIHPLNNLRVLNYLKEELSVSEEQKLDWYKHWVTIGFSAFEALLDAPETGNFCHGDTASLADLCLIPQLFNAHRFSVDLTNFPLLLNIAKNCQSLEAFTKAAPEQ